MLASRTLDPRLNALIAGRGAPLPVRTLMGIRDSGNRVWLSQPAKGLADYVVGLDYRPDPKRPRRGLFVLHVKHGDEVLTLPTPADALIATAAESGSGRKG